MVATRSNRCCKFELRMRKCLTHLLVLEPKFPFSEDCVYKFAMISGVHNSRIARDIGVAGNYDESYLLVIRIRESNSS